MSSVEDQMTVFAADPTASSPFELIPPNTVTILQEMDMSQSPKISTGTADSVIQVVPSVPRSVVAEAPKAETKEEDSSSSASSAATSLPDTSIRVPASPVVSGLNIYNPKGCNAKKEIVTTENVLFLQQHIINLEVEQRRMLHEIQEERRQVDKIIKSQKICEKCEGVIQVRSNTNRGINTNKIRNQHKNSYVTYFKRSSK